MTSCLSVACVHFRENRIQAAKLLRRHALGDPLTDQLVEDLAHIVDLVGFRHRNLPDENSAILLGANQARLFEGPQRLANRPAAGPEAHRQFAFIDALADGELAAQDQLLDLDLHQRGKRVRLHQLQCCLGGLRHRQIRWLGCNDSTIIVNC